MIAEELSDINSQIEPLFKDLYSNDDWND